jgi:antitoxin VapB
MPLYVKDVEVDRLAGRLATLRRTSKTEVVRQALLHELERVEGVPSLVEQGVAFVRALHAQSAPSQGEVVDKAFIDGLYGEP